MQEREWRQSSGKNRRREPPAAASTLASYYIDPGEIQTARLLSSKAAVVITPSCRFYAVIAYTPSPSRLCRDTLRFLPYAHSIIAT
ncbi:hypothetical protein V499_05255 [Pseudogymnoascus sp. VKM F-103]|nr:hypothetical protein V499_05255 [Pseudogymnoascus sp. VKM F-103]